MNSQFWLQNSFIKDNIPTWHCPKCQMGILQLDKNQFFNGETSESLSMRNHDAWDFEWIETKFTGILKCNNSKCNEIIVFSGYGEVEHFQYNTPLGEYHEEYENQFYATYFNPPLNLFILPPNLSKEISLEIKSAFSLYWQDSSSCANKIRVAVEMILNEKKIQKIKISKKKKRIKLTLHERIDKFEQKEPEIASHLRALKWIGNFGSHVEKLTKKDLVNAFEILEFAIEKLYTDKSKKIKQLSKNINRRKGPINS